MHACMCAFMYRNVLSRHLQEQHYMIGLNTKGLNSKSGSSGKDPFLDAHMSTTKTLLGMLT